jgi:hypothetical protein
VLSGFTNTTGDAIFDDTLKMALKVSLRQSPFLNVLSDSEVTKNFEVDDTPDGHETDARGVRVGFEGRAYVSAPNGV